MDRESIQERFGIIGSSPAPVSSGFCAPACAQSSGTGFWPG